MRPLPQGIADDVYFVCFIVFIFSLSGLGTDCQEIYKNRKLIAEKTAAMICGQILIWGWFYER